MVGALIPFIFMYVLCVLQNRGGALIVVPQKGCCLSLWSIGRSGGGRLERLAHVLKLADRHVDGNVENVDGEALQSAERVVETLKEKRKEGSMGHRCWVRAVVLCPMYISILEAVLPISTTY